MNGFSSASKELFNFVDALHLHDLPLYGSPFIFFVSGQNVACSRIDIFLVSNGAGQLVLKPHIEGCHSDCF